MTYFLNDKLVVNWSKIFGNPVSVKLHPKMLEGEFLRTTTAYLKDTPKTLGKQNVFVIYDRDYVTYYLYKNVIETLEIYDIEDLEPLLKESLNWAKPNKANLTLLTNSTPNNAS